MLKNIAHMWKHFACSLSIIDLHNRHFLLSECPTKIEISDGGGASTPEKTNFRFVYRLGRTGRKLDNSLSRFFTSRFSGSSDKSDSKICKWLIKIQRRQINIDIVLHLIRSSAAAVHDELISCRLILTIAVIMWNCGAIMQWPQPSKRHWW